MSSLLRTNVRRRLFHSTAYARHLVGPIDPISNLRPVIYEDDPSLSSRSPTAQSSDNEHLQHPYSLKEFTGDINDYQWKLQRQQLDAFDHLFWSDNNYRYESAKAAVLDTLPENSTPENREAVLTEFYREWLVQETPRQKAYNAEWRKRHFNNILVAARSEYAKVLTTLGFRPRI